MRHYECSNHPSNPNSSVILQNYILITLQYDIPDYMLWERFINWSLSYIIRDLQTWQHCIAMFTRRRQTCTFVISMDNLASFTVWSNRWRWMSNNNLPVFFFFYGEVPLVAILTEIWVIIYIDAVWLHNNSYANLAACYVCYIMMKDTF